MPLRPVARPHFGTNILFSWNLPVTCSEFRSDCPPSVDLLDLLSEAMAAQRLVLNSTDLSLAQLGKREGRCRTQLARLLRLSFLSPRIIEAIVDGTQPKGLSRRALLISEMPIDWVEQERRFGFSA